MPSCPPCQSQARTRTIASYQGLYHNFAATSWYKKPDLIVAFNSGFFDGDDGETDWKQTIRFIVDSGVPSLFTTYNGREAANERRMLDRLGAQLIAEPTQNKWRSLVPVPELLDEEYGFWHQNDYRYIINGKK
jgi:mitochondrial splicing suppressor protein 51